MSTNPNKYSTAIRAVRTTLMERLKACDDAAMTAHWRQKLKEHVQLAHETAAWILSESTSPLLSPDPIQFVQDCGVEFDPAVWAQWSGPAAERSDLIGRPLQ